MIPNNYNIGPNTVPQGNFSNLENYCLPYPPAFYPYGNGIKNNAQQATSNQFLKCKPVSSKEEAKACQIDLDGSLWVFTDLGNNKIYTKQVNNDGTASFKIYSLTEEKESSNNPDSNINTNIFITREEFNKTI